MSRRIRRLLALAFAAFTVAGPAYAMPVEPVGPHHRTDLAQISTIDHAGVRATNPVPATPASSSATAPSDGIDWAFVGGASLIALSLCGAAVALRPRRVLA